VTSFVAGQFETSISLITFLTSWFSHHETQIRDSAISLIPLVSAYQDFEFDRMIWTAFSTKTISVTEPLLPHLQQLSVFPEFHSLFSDHFYLNSLLAYISDSYSPIHLIQYSLFLCFLFPLQSSFPDAIPTFTSAFPALISVLREASATRCLLEVIHSAICAFPELSESPSFLIASLEFPNDPPSRHRLYRICIRLVRQSKAAADLLTREISDLLLEPSDNDTRQLFEDRLKFLRALIERYSEEDSDGQMQLALLQDVECVFDYKQIVAIRDPEDFRCVFPLFSAICRSNANLFLRSIVKPEALCGMIATALEEGSFEVKRSGLQLIGELIDVEALLFTRHLVKEDRFFAIGVDLLESGVVGLQQEFLGLIGRMLGAVTNRASLREELVERFEEAELGKAVQGLYWVEDGKVGALAREVDMKLEYCRREAASFPSFLRRGFE
jgi:hypothetical protein